MSIRAMIAVGTLATFALVSLAGAAEIDRATYKAQVEPICKTSTKANEPLLKAAKRLVRKNTRKSLRQAGAKYAKVSAEMKKAFSKLKAVPQPTADEATLAKWLGYLKTSADLVGKIAKKLKAFNKRAAQNLVNKLRSNSNRANAAVLSFNFNHCRTDISKFI